MLGVFAGSAYSVVVESVKNMGYDEDYGTTFYRTTVRVENSRNEVLYLSLTVADKPIHRESYGKYSKRWTSTSQSTVYGYFGFRLCPFSDVVERADMLELGFANVYVTNTFKVDTGNIPSEIKKLTFETGVFMRYGWTWCKTFKEDIDVGFDERWLIDILERYDLVGMRIMIGFKERRDPYIITPSQLSTGVFYINSDDIKAFCKLIQKFRFEK